MPCIIAAKESVFFEPLAGFKNKKTIFAREMWTIVLLVLPSLHCKDADRKQEAFIRQVTGFSRKEK